MIVSIIPANWVTGNSLHVAHFRDAHPVRLRALYALLSSFVLELQVRRRLATGHMSLGIIRSVRVPQLSGDAIKKLAKVAVDAIENGSDAALEAAVARAYGFTRDDMAEILAQFPKVDSSEREAILDSALWPKERRR